MLVSRVCGCVQGEWQAEVAGTLTLLFDNSFSYFTSKNLRWERWLAVTTTALPRERRLNSPVHPCRSYMTAVMEADAAAVVGAGSGEAEKKEEAKSDGAGPTFHTEEGKAEAGAGAAAASS